MKQNKFERMVDRFQLLIDIEYNQKRVEREVRRSERKAAKTRTPKPDQGEAR